MNKHIFFIVSFSLSITQAMERELPKFEANGDFRDAVLAGDVKRMEAALKIGAQIQALEVKGAQALHIAAHFGYIDVAASLLNHGALVNEQDAIRATPLIHAARSGNRDLVKFLLANGADVGAADRSGFTALMYAINEGHESIFRLLLRHKASIHAKNIHGHTPLILAAFHGRRIIAEVLLERGAKIDEKDNLGRTPLMCAAVGNHPAVVAKLLEAGANHEEKDAQGLTALDLAGVKEHEEVASVFADMVYKTDRIFFAREGDENIEVSLSSSAEKERIIGERQSRKTAAQLNSQFIAAAKKGDLQKCLELIPVCDINARDDEGWTALMHAALKKHNDVVALLLEKRADASCKDKNNITALMIAVIMGCESAATSIIKKQKERLKDKDINQTNILMFALFAGHENLAARILDEIDAHDKKAFVNEKDTGGYTPLMIAVVKDQEKMVRELLDAGASIQATDEFGRGPAHFVMHDNSSRKVFEMLSQAGTDWFAPTAVKCVLFVLHIRSRQIINTILAFSKLPLCIVCAREGCNACGRCYRVRYCSKACQKSDWKIHEKYCIAKKGASK